MFPFDLASDSSGLSECHFKSSIISEYDSLWFSSRSGDKDYR